MHVANPVSTRAHEAIPVIKSRDRRKRPRTIRARMVGPRDTRVHVANPVKAGAGRAACQGCQRFGLFEFREREKAGAGRAACQGLCEQGSCGRRAGGGVRENGHLSHIVEVTVCQRGAQPGRAAAVLWLYTKWQRSLFERETEHLCLRQPLHGIGCHQSMKMVILSKTHCFPLSQRP